MSLYKSSQSASESPPSRKTQILWRALGLGIVAIALIGSSLRRDLPYFLGYRKPTLDYAQLQAELQAENWEAADRLTSQALMDLAQIDNPFTMDAKWFHRMPCADLRAIDTLWSDYSQGRYGFSAQRDIFLEVRSEARIHHPTNDFGRADLTAMNQFTDRVGQGVLTNSSDPSLPGHFPSFSILMKPDTGSTLSGFIPFAMPEVTQRISWCRL